VAATMSDRERAAHNLLKALIDMSVLEIGEPATENLMLRALDLPEKLPGESHAAWQKRNQINGNEEQPR